MTINRRIGRAGQLLAPDYSWCRRCKTPWAFVDDHSTWWGHRGKGGIALCEKCWAELTPQQRLPFYRELVESWHERSDRELAFDDEWAQAKAAVLAGG